MIQSLLLTLLLTPTFALTPSSAAIPEGSTSELARAPAQGKDTADPEFDKRKKEAGQDPVKLWKLYEWCKEQKKDKEGKATLKAILKVDPNHKEANIASGNVFYDEKWFPNQAKVDEYKKEKEKKEKSDQGLVEWKPGEWVAKEDVPFLERGLVKDDVGNWVSGEDAKKIKEGWVKQDLEWIPPAEKANIDKGLWKCADKWLAIADADKYHASLGQWWRIPDGRITLITTCERDVALQKVKKQIDPAYDDLEKIYGIKLTMPINVIVLRNQAQYNDYAAGDEEEQRPTTDELGVSGVHYAYFGDNAFDPDTTDFLGAGVTYWDASSADGNKWGVHAVRHAIGQSFADAVDRSTKAIERAKKTGKFDARAFYEEKKIPTWFRYGAAAYVERYYKDTSTGIGGNPWWTRKWSIENLLSKGGLRPLKQLFEIDPTSIKPGDGAKLINELGLVIAFIMDGNCAPVTEKLKAVHALIKENKYEPTAEKPEKGAKGEKSAGTEKAAAKPDKGDKEKGDKEKKALKEAFAALEAEIIKNEAELRKFAGF